MNSILSFICTCLFLIDYSQAWVSIPRVQCNYRPVDESSQLPIRAHRRAHSDVKLHLQAKPIDISFDSICKVITKSVVSVALCGSLFNLQPSIANAKTGDTFAEVWKIVNDNFYDEKFDSVKWSKLKTYYEEKIRKGTDESFAIKEMISTLGDKYTRLLDKSVLESLYKYDAIGVGVLFETNDGKPMVVASQPITGSSALAAGLAKGDLVYKINGESTEKMTALQLLDRMSNDETDEVSLEYSKPDSMDDRKVVVLKRSKEDVKNPVSYRIVSAADKTPIAYVKLTEFNAQAVKGLENAFKEINKANAKDLVLDLRGNTGGGFQFALNIGGMFMEDKVMAATQARNNENNVFKTSYPTGVLWSKPVVILTDALSASASEVLAGGLHDNCRAVLAGEKTYGKGKIQAVFGLQDGEGLTMTVAQYVTPRGTVIQSKGLQPDIPAPVTNAYLNYILGTIDIAPTPDFQKIDYQKVETMLNTCQP
jgi:carboxyl-terminal processing protease